MVPALLTGSLRVLGVHLRPLQTTDSGSAFSQDTRGFVCTLKFEKDYYKQSPEVTRTGPQPLIGQTEDALGGKSSSSHPLFFLVNGSQLQMSSCYEEQAALGM